MYQGASEIIWCRGRWPWHLWDKCQDQYSWDEWEEMQGDTILGQSAHLNFRIVSMAAPMECWMVAGGSVLHGMGEVQVHRMSTTICTGAMRGERIIQF